ncbi:hypothetical protein [Pectobacterium versatile]|uniref:hypothetical protein n=1 Tax=Pectobacterium versatile TaxID=2488639 RepID=UPI00102ED02A|nr:hypothetical protein [Pectobacterium versatile]TAI99830.1 hypothetical protein EG332_04295 [Pectobacterium versatile]UEQ10485.1 hypothetical protein LLE50_05070 [Pectobacterium versatile]GKX40313.1 hypothetical protein SOASR014_40520 [Pectobacterium carotovorum subsp. carotovorum]GLX46414.1 hypothetical protein Pcaca01_40820 [Pectobacterium carotovorum subsp. carotovorum]
MSNYQQMIDDLVEAYESRLAKSQDEQEWVENEVLTRLNSKSRGIKFNALRGAFIDIIRPVFSEETPCLMQDRDPITAYAESAVIEEYLSGVQYDLMRHCVILERALSVSAAANPTYERLSSGGWVS